MAGVSAWGAPLAVEAASTTIAPSAEATVRRHAPATPTISPVGKTKLSQIVGKKKKKKKKWKKKKKKKRKRKKKTFLEKKL